MLRIIVSSIFPEMPICWLKCKITYAVLPEGWFPSSWGICIFISECSVHPYEMHSSGRCIFKNQGFLWYFLHICSVYNYFKWSKICLWSVSVYYWCMWFSTPKWSYNVWNLTWDHSFWKIPFTVKILLFENSKVYKTVFTSCVRVILWIKIILWCILILLRN